MPRQSFPAGAGVAILALLPAVARADEKKIGMPQLDPSTYASQLFWLLVFFVLFYLFIWKVAMPRVGGIIAERQTQIAGDLGKASRASAEAQTLNRELEATLSASRDQARALVISTTEEERAKAAAQNAALAQELNHRVEVAEASINASRNAALGTIETIATGIVQEILPKLANVDVDYKEAARAVARQGAKKG